jgi:hypothetical protein
MSEGVKVNDVVQIRPNVGHLFEGCFVKVEEVVPWGVLGVVPINKNEVAPVRLEFGHYAKIGEVKWDV